MIIFLFRVLLINFIKSNKKSFPIESHFSYNRVMHRIDISSKSRSEVIDLTASIKTLLKENNFESGILCVYSPHTTSGITVNENADPNVKKDILMYLKKTIPQNFGFDHAEGNADAHIKGSLMGFSQTFIVENGTLQLGTWQGVFFMEFDGPRNREVWLKFIPD